MDANNTLKSSFSNSQIKRIKSIWEELKIIEINSVNILDDCSIGSPIDKKYSFAVTSLPRTNNCTYCTTVDAAASAKAMAAKNSLVYLPNVANFSHRIASKIYQYELKAAVTPTSETNSKVKSIYDVKKLVSDGFEPIKSRYQILVLLALITVIIDYLDNEKPIPKDLVQNFTDAQADVLKQEDYHLFGQSLINTIVDLNRSSLTDDDRATLSIFIASYLDLIRTQRHQAELKIFSPPSMLSHTQQLNYNLDSLHSPLQR